MVFPGLRGCLRHGGLFCPECLGFFFGCWGTGCRPAFWGISRRVDKCRVFGCIFLGIALGLFWFWGYDTVYLGPARLLDGKTEALTFTVTDYPTETRYGCYTAGTVKIQGRRYKTRLYLDDQSLVEPGMVLSLSAKLRLTAGGGETATAHRGKGITLLAYLQGSAVCLREGSMGIEARFAVWRQKLRDLLDAAFPADTAGFARALFLGDSGQLDYDTDTAFRVSGIRHIVAVSGLHISILFSALYLFVGRQRVVVSILGIPLLLLFAGLAGFTPSVTRAVLMQLLILLAMLWNREYDPPTALAFAALVMLVCNPMVITAIGFQLSVGCVAGILLFSQRIHDWLLSDRCLGSGKGKGLVPRIKRWFARSVSVTLGTMVLTTPLCALYFHTVSLISVITNLLTLWAVTLIFYGILLIAAIGFFWLPLAKGIGWVLSWLIRYVAGTAKLLAAVPLAAVYTRSVFVVSWLVFVYLLFGVFLVSRKKHPGVLAVCTALGLCLALLASWVEPLAWECGLTVLDVGQGQCILLQSAGRTYLVDCGGGNDGLAADLAAETLLSQGIFRLDGVILTHYDGDHSGGVPYLLSRVDADGIFLPAAADENGVGETLAARTGGTVVPVAEIMELTFGNARVTIYPPALKNDSNDASLAVLFQTENCGILITGDRGGFGERQLVAAGIPDVDVLVVGHHGSGNSTCPELLQAAKPEIAVISVGEGNPFGHPRQEVLDRLTAAGCVTYRTDTMGTIIFRR